MHLYRLRSFPPAFIFYFTSVVANVKVQSILCCSFNWKSPAILIRMLAESKARVCRPSITENAGSNPAEGMDYISCVLSGRGLCEGPIPRPDESYRLLRVTVCDLET
jgi:hypothetical protein